MRREVTRLTVDHGADVESPSEGLVERELAALAARADSCIYLTWEGSGTLTAHAAGNRSCIVGFMPEDVDAPRPTLVDPSQATRRARRHAASVSW